MRSGLLSLLIAWLSLAVSAVDDDILNEKLNENNSEQCSVGLQELPLQIDTDLTLHLLQAPTAFQGVEHDVTGTVVWGASVCLARFVADRHASVVTDKTTLELGCGCGLPSLVAAKRGDAKRIVATDLEHATLQQLDAVARRNGLQDQLELFQLDWKDSYENDNEKATSLVSDDGHSLFQADVILASDVIYHQSMVSPLVQTIHKYLSTNDGAKAYLALRNTRQGVSSFWQEAMPRAGFVLVETISCDDYLKYGDSDLKSLPGAFQNEANSHRWRGDHTIYVFQRGKGVE